MAKSNKKSSDDENVIEVEDSSIATRGKVAGQTILAETVVETIAGVAAREVDGVYLMGRGALSHALGRVTGTADTTQGVIAEVGKREVAIDLEMVVEYGYDIRSVCEQVRALVTERLEHMTGLKVKEINVQVKDVHFETAKPTPEAPRVE